MKQVMLGAFGLLALAACAPSGQMSYTLVKQPAAANLSPAGTVMRATRFDGYTNTSVQLSGLAPNTYYVAHYHLQGDAGAPPCQSGGMPVMATKLVGRTDASGNLSMSGAVPTSATANTTYFNVHTAKDADGTPADGGVACANLQ